MVTSATAEHKVLGEVNPGSGKVLISFSIWNFSVATRSLDLCPDDGNSLAPVTWNFLPTIGEMWVNYRYIPA